MMDSPILDEASVKLDSAILQRGAGSDDRAVGEPIEGG